MQRVVLRDVVAKSSGAPVVAALPVGDEDGAGGISTNPFLQGRRVFRQPLFLYLEIRRTLPEVKTRVKIVWFAPSDPLDQDNSSLMKPMFYGRQEKRPTVGKFS